MEKFAKKYLKKINWNVKDFNYLALEHKRFSIRMLKLTVRCTRYLQYMDSTHSTALKTILDKIKDFPNEKLYSIYCLLSK